ncbi:MAG: hypothetical protein FGM18_04480 [Burkholderiaceae bacterium]|nr:hypothetical protein [Burkholderiaceae bacterium]
MNNLSILFRSIKGPALLASISLLALGCSPKMDWREVRPQAIGASVLFPAKPVEVSRTLQPSSAASPLTLTLKSARIENTLFALGWVMDGPQDARSQLEAAMLANIQAMQSSIRRKALVIEGQTVHELLAEGRMRVDATSPEVPARLWMRSLVLERPNSPGQTSTAAPNKAAFTTIEIIALGPAQELREEDARQFIESLKLSQ